MSRRYDDREFDLILRGATESGAPPATLSSPPDGLTLAEIKAAAAEVGIAPHDIDAAAARMEAASGLQNPPPLTGLSTVVRHEALLEGLELDDVPTGDVLDRIRSWLQRHGIVESEPGGVTWRAGDALGSRSVTVSATSEGVRLRVLGNYRVGLQRLFMVTGMASLGLSSVVLEGVGLGTGWAVAAAVALTATGTRFAYRWWRRDEDRQMTALYDDLSRFLRESPSGD